MVGYGTSDIDSLSALGAKVVQAFDRLREVFLQRIESYDVPFCPCCFEPREMHQLLRRSPGELSAQDLRSILRDAFHTWGDWPSFAVYVPRLLELYAQDEWSWDTDYLFYKLVWAVRPEDFPDAERRLAGVGERMAPNQRKAVFELVGAVADAWMRQDAWDADYRPYPDSGCIERLKEALRFLAVFDVSLESLIEGWKALPDPAARGRFCVFLAEWAFSYDPAYPTIEECFWTLPVLPENARVLAALVDPAFVASYLAEHTEDAALFGPEHETGVSGAFDWATSRLGG